MLPAPVPPGRRYNGKIANPDRWNDFKPRAGDVIVSTPPKSGTTWMQGIRALLISGTPDVDAAVSRNAPWIDIDTPEQDEIIAARLRERLDETQRYWLENGGVGP